MFPRRPNVNQNLGQSLDPRVMFPCERRESWRICPVLLPLDYLLPKVFHASLHSYVKRLVAQKKVGSKRPSPAIQVPLQVLPPPVQPTYQPIDLASVPPPIKPILDRDYVAAENLDFEHIPDSEIKRLLGVSQYPSNDLSKDLPGIPPTDDFSKAKAQNQVSHDTFIKTIEPYFRPFTEDDLTFLRQQVPLVSFGIINPLG
jgi:hypothetical protein